MSKPEEIPQDVMYRAHMAWQEANTVDSLFTADGQGSKYIPIIALAILAAEKRGEEREREACAQMASNRAERFRPGWPKVVLEGIAAGIRLRGGLIHE